VYRPSQAFLPQSGRLSYVPRLGQHSATSILAAASGQDRCPPNKHLGSAKVVDLGNRHLRRPAVSSTGRPSRGEVVGHAGESLLFSSSFPSPGSLDLRPDLAAQACQPQVGGQAGDWVSTVLKPSTLTRAFLISAHVMYGAMRPNQPATGASPAPLSAVDTSRLFASHAGHGKARSSHSCRASS
jgi:hypothetical protein